MTQPLKAYYDYSIKCDVCCAARHVSLSLVRYNLPARDSVCRPWCGPSNRLKSRRHFTADILPLYNTTRVTTTRNHAATRTHFDSRSDAIHGHRPQWIDAVEGPAQGDAVLCARHVTGASGGE